MAVKIAKQVDRIYIAGDDDQAIYEWNMQMLPFSNIPRCFMLKNQLD